MTSQDPAPHDADDLRPPASERRKCVMEAMEAGLKGGLAFGVVWTIGFFAMKKYYKGFNK